MVYFLLVTVTVVPPACSISMSGCRGSSPVEELPGELEQGQLGKLQRHQKVGFSNDIS